jgi:hypothetical protein
MSTRIACACGVELNTSRVIWDIIEYNYRIHDIREVTDDFSQLIRVRRWYVGIRVYIIVAPLLKYQQLNIDIYWRLTMKTSKKVLSSIVLVLAILGIIATPVLADPRSLECNGASECRINVLQGVPNNYPAGAPFFIIHSAGEFPPNPPAAGNMGFALELDGVYVTPNWSEHSAVPLDHNPDVVIILSTSAFNFPQGLPAGRHTFTGHWYWMCLNSDPECKNPSVRIDRIVETLTVTFR